MSMNILMFHPTMDIGGAAINNIVLASKLQAFGHRVVFLADDGPLVEELRARGIGYRHLAYRGRSDLTPGVLRDIVKAIRNEGIEVVWTAGVLPCVKAHMVCWWTKTPLFPLHGSHLVPRFYLPRIGRCGWVNPHHRDYMVNALGWRDEDVLLVRGRMELDAYRPRPAIQGILRRYGLHEGERSVVLIGNVIQEKWGSVTLFLDAARMLAEKHRTLRFVIVGEGLDGDREHYEQCRDLVAAINQRCGLEAVLLTGALRQIPDVMHEADIVAGMASTCIQSLLCGRPTIVLGNRGVSGIITPETFDAFAYHHFNLHEPSEQRQPEGLCDQVERLLHDERWRRELGEWGRTSAAGIFDVNVGARQLEQALREAVADHQQDFVARTKWLLEILKSLGSAGMYKWHKGSSAHLGLAGRGLKVDSG